jgi:glycosyltransferase involved in cell wall biosynthesis
MGPDGDPDAVGRVRRSALFDGDWYARAYPDVARLPLDPATHYAWIGAYLARDPGPHFAARAYLAANPDVAAAGLDPLTHYLTAGRAEGRAAHPGAGPVRVPAALRRLKHLRDLMETGGLDAGPRAALAEMAMSDAGPEAAAGAAEALGLMALHRGEVSEARAWLARRQEISGEALARLAPVMAIAAAQDGDRAAAEAIAARAPHSPALHLARVWWARTEAEALGCFNDALRLAGHAPVALGDGAGALMDRLMPVNPGAQGSEDGPLISVLMAAHDSAATIETALRAMEAQSWWAFELLVIDDASRDATAQIVAAHAARDPRIRLIRLAQNQGAYGARNAGLAEARGRFVTLHDADDWSHPDRLRLQVEFLLRQPGHVGCLSQQARCLPDLRPCRWTGTGALIFENMTSLMLPTDLVRDCLGGWDAVRVSADSELLRRVRQLFGESAVAMPETGPLALQRASGASATGDGVTGMDWFYYGARREYYEAQLHHHARALHLWYRPGGARAFAAPARLCSGVAEVTCDRVYAGLMTMRDAGVETLLGWLAEDRAAGRTAGLVPLYDLAMPEEAGLTLHPCLRALVDGAAVRVLCHGEVVRCARYRRLPGQSVTEAHRYLPVVLENDWQVLAPGEVPAEDATGTP